MPVSKICIDDYTLPNSYRVKYPVLYNILAHSGKIMTELFSSFGTFTALIALTTLVFGGFRNNVYNYLILSAAGFIGLSVFIYHNIEGAIEIKKGYKLFDKIDDLKEQVIELIKRNNDAKLQLERQAEKYLALNGIEVEFKDIFLSSYTEKMDLSCEHYANTEEDFVIKKIGIFLKRTHDIIMTAAVLEGITDTSALTHIELNRKRLAIAIGGSFLLSLSGYAMFYFFFKKPIRHANKIYEQIIEQHNDLQKKYHSLIRLRDKLTADTYRLQESEQMMKSMSYLKTLIELKEHQERISIMDEAKPRWRLTPIYDDLLKCPEIPLRLIDISFKKAESGLDPEAPVPDAGVAAAAAGSS